MEQYLRGQILSVIFIFEFVYGKARAKISSPILVKYEGKIGSFKSDKLAVKCVKNYVKIKILFIYC